jgi:Sec-independent protein translocase protein TatA
LSKCLWQNWLQKQDFKMTSMMFVTSWYSTGFNRMIVNAKREDAVKLESLKLPSNPSLQDLRRIATSIEATQLVFPESHAQREIVRTKVQAAIKEIETFCSALPSTLGSARSQQEVKALADQINRRRFQFSDAPELQVVEGCVGRAEQLQAFFASLAGVRTDNLKTPNDLAELQNALRTTLSEFRSAISETQAALAQQALEKLNTRAAQMRQSADEWLAARSAPYKKEDMPRLLAELRSPPAFLAPERMPGLQAIRNTIQEQVDGDEVHQVIAHFQKITDLQKRRNTLDQLQQLL